MTMRGSRALKDRLYPIRRRDIIHAAKLAGLGLDEAIDSAGNLKEFRDFLKARRSKSKVAAEMLELLSAYLDQ